MATRTASYGNIQSNTQSNTPDPPQLNNQSNTPDPALDPALDPYDSQSQFAPRRSKKVSLIQTDLMEETLFNELYKQDRLGKCADIGFKSKAQVAIQDAVQDVYIRDIVIEVS